MLLTLRTYWRKWRVSRHAGQQLDALLAHADPTAPLGVRNQWLIELAHWLHRGGSLPDELRHDAVEATGKGATFPPHTRLRYLLQMLERNPAWRLAVARTLRSIIHESDAMSLLCDTGMPVRSGFWGALVERLETHLIPPPPTRRDLGALFTLMFNSADDAEWVVELPDDLRIALADLLQFEVTDDERDWNRFAQDLMAAMHNLVSQIGSTGLSYAVRTRLAEVRTTELPFYRLSRAMQAVEDAEQDFGSGAPPSQRLLQQVNYFRLVLDDCRRAIGEVYAHLDDNGVSVEIVFQVERMRTRIRRLERLLEAWLATGNDALQARISLLADLIRANRASQSVASLARTSFGLLARKVVERSAETGEHYIAKDRPAYLSMLKMAAGGGLVTVATVYLKFFIVGAHLQPMVEGLLAGLNYAASFLLMHFCHFTLATKQPAMTAPAIAGKLDGVHTPEGMAAFVDEVIALVRTQAAAIFGNLALVFPGCLLLQWLAASVLGVDLISPAKASATLTSFSLLGWTPIYAALTGVLLWFSSVLSGWADNWFAFHRLGDVLAYNRRLRFVFGDRGAARLAAFCREHVSGVVGNAGLGMMLGLVPAIFTAFALPFEVRHVTLSTGAIAAALGVLGPQALDMRALWLAVSGITCMAILNVGVSFMLAFQMALRSRPLRPVDRRQIHRAIWRTVWRNPLCLIFPIAPKAKINPE
ncbi:MAG: site-specific recombinase [Burkholderiales bacterium]|nr:site-specific recombinase [Burkholderiales bacterium]